MSGLAFDVGQWRMLVDWTKDPACGLFLSLLRTRAESHEAFVLRPTTDARRVDFERGGLDAAKSIEKLLTSEIESFYRRAVEQEPPAHDRSDDAAARSQERHSGDVERGPE